MAEQIQPIRGMNDILPEQIGAWQSLERVVRDLVTAYGYQEMRVPIVEQTALFKRSIGEFTDVVGKEMYSFESQGGESLTLRTMPAVASGRSVRFSPPCERKLYISLPTTSVNSPMDRLKRAVCSTMGTRISS